MNTLNDAFDFVMLEMADQIHRTLVDNKSSMVRNFLTHALNKLETTNFPDAVSPEVYSEMTKIVNTIYFGLVLCDSDTTPEQQFDEYVKRIEKKLQEESQ